MMTDDARVTRRRARANARELDLRRDDGGGDRARRDVRDGGRGGRRRREGRATTTTMDAKRANDRGDEGGGTDEEDEEETEEREEEYLGRIRRRARGAEVGEESEEDDEEAGDEDGVGGGRGARRRRLKRANGERVVRARGVESDVDSSDSSDLEEEDEELVMERKHAETGRLTDEGVEEEDAEAKRENALESGAFDDEEAYSSDSSEGIPVVDDVEAPASGGGRKKTKKQLKKEREAPAQGPRAHDEKGAKTSAISGMERRSRAHVVFAVD